MGKPGPVPKRSSERRRRNKESRPDRIAPPAKLPSAELAGKALRDRAAELAIVGRSKMKAPELRAAVLAASGGDSRAPAGRVTPPQVDPRWHPIAKSWFESLAESGQVHYFEPSDWQAARYVAEVMSRHLNRKVPSAQLFTGIWGAMTDLLTTESARRRVKIEVERNTDDQPEHGEAEVARLDAYRQRLTS